MPKLSNSFLTFDLDPESRTFTLKSSIFPQARIDKAEFAIELVKNSPTDFGFKPDSLVLERRTDARLGNLALLSLDYIDQTRGLLAKVEFAMPSGKPFLYQRLSVKNLGAKKVNPERFRFASIERSQLQFGDRSASQTSFFSNGWQSWSPTGVWHYGDKQVRSNLIGLSTPMLYNTGTPITRKASHFSSDMFAAVLDQQVQVGLLFGFLSQREQFGSVEAKLHPEPELSVWANCDQIELLPGSTLESDWLAWQFFDTASAHPFEPYLQMVAVENEIRPRMKTPVGWCSWYYYFQKITPTVLRSNLNALDQVRQTLPLDFFQIDDGFEQDVGSWLKFHPSFPEGVAPIAGEIREKDFTPGLWLAPFILEHKSDIIKLHPDWLLRKPNGKPVNSGFVWDWLGKALDLTLPDVQEYVREVIRTAVDEWKFPYLKLDFLYAAALPGKFHNPTLTRAQVLRKALELVREEAGDECILLGCGVPLGSGLGIFDMMRISADVSPAWDPEFAGLKSIFHKEPNMPSARNAIQNILSRAMLDPYLWVNDPDCLLVRDDSKLSLAEVQSLATAISITGGAFLISDDMSKLNPERLKIAASLLPVLPPNPEVSDLFSNTMPSKLRQSLQGAAGEWELIALFNWADEPRDLTFTLEDLNLAASTYLMREYWSGESAIVEKSYQFKQVSTHGVRLFTLRRLNSLTYLGSDLHLSQGIELNSWKVVENKLHFTLDLSGRHTNGTIYLWSDRTPLSIVENGKEISWTSTLQNVLAIPVNLFPSSDLSVVF